MLARSAHGLYWIGRYLKRVEHTSRLMELQMNALVDCTWDQIHFGWLRLFRHLKTAPHNEELVNWEEHGDSWGLTDSFALADELSFVYGERVLDSQLFHNGTRKCTSNAPLH